MALKNKPLFNFRIIFLTLYYYLSSRYPFYMTIKIRNRFNIIFSIIAIVITSLNVLLFTYQILTKSFIGPEVYIADPSPVFLFKYNPLFVVIGIFLLDIYVIVTSILVHRNFEKTQSTEIVFFLIFLISCLFDTMRILVPLLRISNTYSRLLMQVAYVTLFARVLAPLSILGITVLSDDEARQNVDRNCIFIIITALFFAKLIPFNTGVINANFCVAYGYSKILRYSSFFICIASISALIISNKRNEYGQVTTIGLILFVIGYSAMFFCYNLFLLILGPLLLCIGTFIYLKSLHKQFMWMD